MYMASPRRPERANEAGSEPDFSLARENAVEGVATPAGDTEDDVFSESENNGATAEPEGEGEGDGEDYIGNEQEPVTQPALPKFSPILGMTETEIKSQQAALANEYSQLAWVFSRALEKRVSLTLKRLERLEKKGGAEGDKEIKFERPPVARLGKLLSYQVSSIQANSRHEALNIWRDFYRQKTELRSKLRFEKQKKITRLQRGHSRSAMARNTDVSVLDWISANLDIVHYLRTQRPLSALEAKDAISDIRLMKKPADRESSPSLSESMAEDDDMDEDNDNIEESDENAAVKAGKVLASGMEPVSFENGLSQLTAAIGSPELKRRRVYSSQGQSSPPKPAAPGLSVSAKQKQNQSSGRVSPTPVIIRAKPPQPSQQQADSSEITKSNTKVIGPSTHSSGGPSGLNITAPTPQAPLAAVLNPIEADVPRQRETPPQPNPSSQYHTGPILPTGGPTPLMHPGSSLPPTPSRVPQQIPQNYPTQSIPQQQQHQHQQQPQYNGLVNQSASPQGQYTTGMLPAPQGFIPHETQQHGLQPQGVNPPGLVAAGYPYYSGYPIVQGFPQYQYSSQPANMPPQQPQGTQGYIYDYQNQWQFVPPNNTGPSAPWQGQYAVWPPPPPQ